MFGRDDDQLIMAVAQESFEASFNRFCKLVPLAYRDGTQVNPDDFPNDGEIWWMLTMTTAHLAEPGRLVVGPIEKSVRYDETIPGSSFYQVIRDKVRALEPRIGIEIIDVQGDAIDKIQDVVSGGFTLHLTHPPTPQALLHWRGDIYGPFTPSVASLTAHAPSGEFAVSFFPSDVDMTIFHLGETEFRRATDKLIQELSTEISYSSVRRAESPSLSWVQYQLLLEPGYERMLAQNPTKLALEPLESKLGRFAKKLIQKKKRRELLALLDELEITGRTTEDAEDLLQALSEARLDVEKQASALDAVTKALLETGEFGDERIREALEVYERQYVEERTLVLQAQIDERASSKRDELQQIERKLSDMSARLQEEEAAYRENYRSQLAAERQESERKITAEKKLLEQQRTELEVQQTILQNRLEKVTQEWRESGEELIERYLAIEPLIRTTARAHASSGTDPNAHVSTRAPTPSAMFELPAYIHGTARISDTPLSEDAFLDRFQSVVEESGFDYAKIDLIRFHLSVRVGALSVVGGPSGIGKSSLPLLYGRALAGEESGAGRPGCLMVSVNPSWMDVRDLLGHWNPVEGRFYPAESGLFEYLIFAQEEYKSRQASTGIYLACLDEMNLSQVEYYFSDLMMVLEREGDQRQIKAFADSGPDSSDPFRYWSTLNLPPSVRFVGTVNFDETTRLLSDRLLDRCNMIQLRSGAFPTVTLRASGPTATAKGRMVTVADFQSWQGGDPLSPEIASLLNDLRPILQQLGTPISPRVYRAIHQFVSSSGPLLSPDKAFDLQLAQRVAPKIRNLVTRRQIDALDDLVRLLTKSSVGPFDETLPYLENVQQTAIGRDWSIEE
jgi:hypothetical protein